ncbi:MAG: PilZ domain-containing protein [Deltaproteobacteria bacterium]|jgi:hypothetical protein|nr:PilZ domain-containing protein [Deltaproteobacteria bacterium]MBW2481429.1 PilZ domain-containing protein [Deltaproteobacteria bacterium]
MTEKVYITSKQMATFICPQCQKSKTVDVSKYANLDKIVKVKVSCPCGYGYTSILEKRKKYRKQTNLPGSFVRLVDGRRVGGGLMTVKDLSTSGLKIQTNVQHNCAVGDVVLVDFTLDDSHRTLIKKKVIVRNIVGQHIGTEFAPTEAIDKALGFYLFS